MKITSTTRAIERTRVNWMSEMEARIVWVRSTGIAILIAAGIAARIRGSAFSIFATVSMTLAPGCLKTGSRIARVPFAQAASLSFSGPSMAWPMSRMRTGAPFR